MRVVLHKANRLLAGLSGWLMLAMMALLVLDIAFRTGGRPLHGLAELSVFVMMIVIYLGLARCEEYSEHVNLDIALRLLSARTRRVVIAAVQLLAVGTIGLMAYAVTTDAWAAYVTNSAIEGLVDLPIWPTKFVMVVGMAFFLLQAVVNLIDAVLAVRGNETSRISQ